MSAGHLGDGAFEPHQFRLDPARQRQGQQCHHAVGLDLMDAADDPAQPQWREPVVLHQHAGIAIRPDAEVGPDRGLTGTHLGAGDVVVPENADQLVGVGRRIRCREDARVDGHQPPAGQSVQPTERQQRDRLPVAAAFGDHADPVEFAMAFILDLAALDFHRVMRCPVDWRLHPQRVAELLHVDEGIRVAFPDGEGQVRHPRRRRDRKSGPAVQFVVQDASKFVIAHECSPATPIWAARRGVNVSK